MLLVELCLRDLIHLSLTYTTIRQIGLPTELATGTTYIQFYIETILAFQSRYATPGTKLPLCIMTSGDTNAKTVALLSKNNYFGMDKDQITIVNFHGVILLLDILFSYFYLDC